MTVILFLAYYFQHLLTCFDFYYINIVPELEALFYSFLIQLYNFPNSNVLCNGPSCGCVSWGRNFLSLVNKRNCIVLYCTNYASQTLESLE